MKKTIRPILRDDLSRKGLEKRIDLRVYLDGRQTKFATPYSIAPACWDKKSGRVVGNCPEKSVINSYLNGKETESNAICSNAKCWMKPWTWSESGKYSPESRGRLRVKRRTPPSMKSSMPM